MLVCFKASDPKLEGFVNADLAGDIDTQKSTTNCVFILCDTTISAGSNLQKVGVLSTTEVEYVATTKAVKEMV